MEKENSFEEAINEFKKAEQFFLKALELDSQNPEIHYNLKAQIQACRLKIN